MTDIIPVQDLLSYQVCANTTVITYIYVMTNDTCTVALRRQVTQ